MQQQMMKDKDNEILNLKNELNKANKIIENQKIADEYKLKFYETSAKNGINVNEIFEDLVEKVDEVYSKLEVPKTEVKNKLYTGKTKKSCC